MPEAPHEKHCPHPWSAAKRRAAEAPGEGPTVFSPRPRHACAEVRATSNFTFLTGASHPEELVAQAAALGYRGLAVTDTNTLAGIVRAHVAAKEHGLPLAIGSRLRLRTGGSTEDAAGRTKGEADHRGAACTVLVYPTDRAAYGRLCRLLTLGKRRTVKGECDLTLHDLLEHQEGLLAVVESPERIDEGALALLEGLRRVFDEDRLSLAAARRDDGRDRPRLRRLMDLADHVRIPLAASNDVRYHVPDRKPLADMLSCIRHGCTLEEAGFRLAPNAERFLKPPEEMARLFADCPAALQRSVELIERASAFGLDALRYEYPHETCPPDRSAMQHLRDLTRRGAAERYPDGAPEAVARRLEHEFELIADLGYPHYFLTVHDLVNFARSRGILCQGRGAAANSAVCYCLGVTAVDPARIDLLFERFISRERNEPPDIDIDFEHERREEVIQYIYRKYGRDRAALTAEVITYRSRSAVREVGKTLGLGLDAVDRLARSIDWFDPDGPQPDRLRELGFQPDDPTLRHLTRLTGQILGFPRHLSQHVGGFVITDGPLCESVPIENAAMEDRTVIEWDKDDIDAVGMLKVDVLGLGMMTCLNKSFRLIWGLGIKPYGGVKVEGRHEGTEARRHKEKNRRKPCTTGELHGEKQYLSGPDRLAEGDGFGEINLFDDADDASGRTLRPHESDTSIRGGDPLEYRRGLRSTEQQGLPEVSPDSARLPLRTGYAVRTSHVAEHDPTRPTTARDHHRTRPHPPGPYPQHPELEQTLTPSVPSCLRAYVPSCLPHTLPCLDLASIPPADPAVYDMICNADTVGVFQIESRAQMSMLPRLKPRTYYDLVIEVAIVRPGPIVGEMVHPYLRRRNGEEPIDHPDSTVERILGRTLGVPLFQEQAMQLAIHCAGFTPDEADQLRRAIAAWKSKTKVILEFGQRIIDGMVARGYSRAFAERCFQQMKGFSEYGFPESHAASFALLVYVSAWLKCHYPAAFAAALINSQPMGFYAPAQIIRDAKAHGVTVRPIDVHHSDWDCTLEDGGAAIRLGMRLVKGLGEADGRRLAEAVREHGRFASVASLWRASGASAKAMRRLAAADAMRSLGLDRQQALWAVRGFRDESLPLFDAVDRTRIDRIVELPTVDPQAAVLHDYRHTGLSLKAHPISFLRDRLDRRGVQTSGALADEQRWPHGKRVAVAGVVINRQRPGTASGVVFMTLEDETGIANLILKPDVFERYRTAARHRSIVLARGVVQRAGQVVHVLVRHIEGLDLPGQDAPFRSRDFR